MADNSSGGKGRGIAMENGISPEKIKKEAQRRCIELFCISPEKAALITNPSSSGSASKPNANTAAKSSTKSVSEPSSSPLSISSSKRPFNPKASVFVPEKLATIPENLPAPSEREPVATFDPWQIRIAGEWRWTAPLTGTDDPIIPIAYSETMAANRGFGRPSIVQGYIRRGSSATNDWEEEGLEEFRKDAAKRAARGMRTNCWWEEEPVVVGPEELVVLEPEEPVVVDSEEPDSLGDVWRNLDAWNIQLSNERQRRNQ